MKNRLKILVTFSLILSIFSLMPVQVAAAETSQEVQQVKDCFAGKTMASNKLECVFNETFITYFLIPSILVFAIVYGLVEKLDFFKSSAINALIGLGFALLVMFNAGQLSMIGDTISDMGPGPIMFILLLLVIIWSAVKQTTKNNQN